MDKIDKIFYQIEKNLGFNQLQLAEKMGVTAQTVNKWKTRKNIPKNNKLKLNDLFNISLNFLETGEGAFYDNDVSDKNLSIIESVNSRKTYIKSPIGQSDISEILGVDQSNISRYENGIDSPSITKLCKPKLPKISRYKIKVAKRDIYEIPLSKGRKVNISFPTDMNNDDLNKVWQWLDIYESTLK